MKDKLKKACIYGFDPGLQGTLKEILYFSGMEPVEVEDASGLSRIFKSIPPEMIIMPDEALEMLDFHVMIGNDPQFDNVVILIGVRDVESPRLKRLLETCGTDFFLISHPYHLKRQAMAVMALNPWEGVPPISGKILLADQNLERRISIARSLRVAKFDVDFAESEEEVLSRISETPKYRIIICSSTIGNTKASEIIKKAVCEFNVRPIPWLIYDEVRIFKKDIKEESGDLFQVGNELSPEHILFHVQNILSTPQKEMRKSERLPYFTPVKISIDRIKEEMWGFSGDISENGLFIRTLVPPPPDMMVTLTFKPPTAEGMVKVGARVAWRKQYGEKGSLTKPPGFGVEFVRVSEPDRAAILTGYNILLKTVKLGKV